MLHNTDKIHTTETYVPMYTLQGSFVWEYSWGRIVSHNKDPLTHLSQTGREEIWPSGRNEKNQLGKSMERSTKNNENFNQEITKYIRKQIGNQRIAS